MAYYQENTLSIASRNSLAQLLAELINANEAVEDFRESLAAVPGFDGLSLFRWLDRQQKGFLAERDLEFLVGTTHRKLLTYAFSWVDVGKVGEVSRFEFANFLLPRENLHLREENLRNLEESQVKGEANTLGVQLDRFQGLLKELMCREMKIIDLRRSIISSKDYSLEAVRFALSSDRQWVCAGDIHTFMRNFGFQVSSRQTEALVEVISKNGEGKISMEALRWVVEGLQNKDKQYIQKVKASNKKKPFPKPTIQESKVKRYFSNQKHTHNQKQQEFTSLMSRIKAIERQQKKHEKMLIQSQKNRIQSARRTYEQEIVQLHLKREEQSVRKIQQREAKLAQHQMQLQIDQLLLKTARLQQESERLIREQNRINILQDSASIKKQVQAQLCAQEYDRIVKAHARQRIAFSPPHAHSQLRRLSIESHIRASEEYLSNARYAHKKLMRDHKQRSLIFNKENEIGQELNKKKTPGTFLNKAKTNNEPLSISNKQPQNIAPEVVTDNPQLTSLQ